MSAIESRYWVVGGEYTSMDFTRLAPGEGHVLGPFANRTEAEQNWRRLSEERRCEALVRYTIAQEPTPQRDHSAMR